MHAAMPIFLSAILVLMAALLLPLGILFVRRATPPRQGQAPLPLAPLPILPHPARTRPAALIAAGQSLRAPPTFPARRLSLGLGCRIRG